MRAKPNLQTVRKLAIAKYVYAEGTRQRARGTSVARLMAVVDYDLAIETALKAVIKAVDPSHSPKADFGDLVQQVGRVLVEQSFGDLPQAASIQVVRSVRNAAQHEGRLPTPEEESECHLIARSFLDDILMRVWGLSADEVRLGQLVVDADSKSRLGDAEALLTEGDFSGAIAKAGEALEFALNRVKNALVGVGDTWVRAILTEDSFGKPRASRDLTRSIERTQETVLYLALGLDYSEYLRFKAIAGEVHLLVGGGAHHVGMKENPDRPEAEFVVSYASEAIVQIEGRVGSLEKPFGRAHWY